MTPYREYIELAEKLNTIAPGPSPKKTIFLTTGAEAVENAVKIARAATGRRAVISFSGGFHGRTFMGMALTGKVAPYKAQFGEMPGDVYHLPYPAAYLGTKDETVFAALDLLAKSSVPINQVAAMIIEPVQGEGGFYQASAPVLKRLRKLCDEHGILLIVDEIQSGFARTGKMFAIEHAGIEPDLMTLAKAMGGGFPLSAVVGKADVMDKPEPGGLGGTYGGSPPALAAGIAVLKAIETENLCSRAEQIGRRIKRTCQDLQRVDAGIGDVRGLGAMVAVELVKDGDPNKPDPDRTKAVVNKAREKGLLLLSCGVRGNVIRFLPPLTMPSEHLAEGLSLFAQAINETSEDANASSRLSPAKLSLNQT